MKPGQPRSTGEAPSQKRTGSRALPERVDWSAIMEQRSLVPDSEEASPVVVPPATRPRSGRSVRLVAAAAALFSVVTGAAVVFELWQANREDTATPAPAPAASKPAEAGPDLGEEPIHENTARALIPVEAGMRACARQNGVRGVGLVRMKVEPDGQIASSSIREGGEKFQRCVARALHRIRLPATPLGGTIVHEVTLSDP
ncbi:MAG TPA: hypothetical protein VEL05_07945 [Candidatus Acidoferrum sp.]|nr:hypothetical protein [Candidatus Acidoferrum sp.]